MNILIIGTKIKLLPIYNYCKEKGYGILCISLGRGENTSDFLAKDAISHKELSDKTFYNFFPDQIINFKEQPEYLQ